VFFALILALMVEKDDKKLISLKEAAKLTGYSADYIGQLIRSGKIPGKQVYMNVAWMTTAEAILEYKNKSSKNKSVKDNISIKKRKIALELSILKLFFSTFKSAIPLFLIIIFSFIILFSVILYNLLSPNIPKQLEQNEAKEDILSF
jgi:hypothetical protein